MAAKGEGEKSEKSLEMRVAELEDKLKGMQVSEEEMRAFNKVSALMGGLPQTAVAGEAAAASAAIPAPDNCVIQQCVRACTVVQQCTIVSQCIRPCVIQQCIRACTIVQNCVRACTIISDCINECGGGCAPGGGGFSTGGFGSLGG